MEVRGLDLMLGEIGARAAVTSLYGHIAETFSVMPLAGLAAAVLTGRVPRLHGGLPPNTNHLGAASGEESAQRFVVLCSDPQGPLAAAAVRRL